MKDHQEETSVHFRAERGCAKPEGLLPVRFALRATVLFASSITRKIGRGERIHLALRACVVAFAGSNERLGDQTFIAPQLPQLPSVKIPFPHKGEER